MNGKAEAHMDFSTLLRASEEGLQEALEQKGELDVTVTEDARLLVRRGDTGGYVADLRVKGATVVLVREGTLDRFRQRVKEQIAIHVSRDSQPDLTEP
jgi:hypothetical protein